nr:hypothetical protein [Candidatus Cloacimonadota bacterium]
MKRFVLIAAMFVLLMMQLEAKYSDEYLIGTYSFLNNTFPFFAQNRELLSHWMQEMGYNSNIIETRKDDQELATLLRIMDEHGLDAWITDRGYSPDPESEFHYAIAPLSTSSQYIFEAEYLDERDVNPGDGKDSRFWYAFRNDGAIERIGRVHKDPEASNGHIWMASRGRDNAGYALGDLRYRWPNIYGSYVRMGREFNHYQINPPDHEDAYYWITYRFRISNVDPNTKAGDPLLRFEVAGYELSEGSYASRAKVIRAASENNISSQNLYRYQDYQQSKDTNEYVEYVLKIPYKELLDANLLQRPDNRIFVLSNLNPRLWWYGNCDLELDYVKVQDQFAYELVNADAEYKQKIITRAQNLIRQGQGNVSGFYAFDEPLQGQIPSYKILDHILAEKDINLMTATYDYQSSNIVIDANKGIFYDHLDHFINEAQPLIFAPDIYPVRSGYSFMPGVKDREFLQDVWEYKLIRVYEAGIRYRLQDPSRRFYPIVQAFGRWAKGNPDFWITWIRPPYATQKALLYLPLVYQADGIFHYRLQSFQSSDGYGDYVGLNTHLLSPGIYSTPETDPITMNAILHSNPKVKRYGAIIKELTWVDAATIMGESEKRSEIPASSLIEDIYVLEQPNAPYSGYIQCGYYLDEDKVPYLMLVNRRGNYFTPFEVETENLVPPEAYAEHFPQADPQTLMIKFNKSAQKRFGEYIGFCDPMDGSILYYDKMQGAIEIPAGEARLLKMVQTLPSILEGKVNLTGEREITGSVTLAKNANLSLDKNGKITLLPGASLIVPKDATITLAGEIILLGDSQIIIEGYLKEKEHKFINDGKATIIINPQPKRSFWKRLFGIE